MTSIVPLVPDVFCQDPSSILTELFGGSRLIHLYIDDPMYGLVVVGLDAMLMIAAQTPSGRLRLPPLHHCSCICPSGPTVMWAGCG